MEKLQTQASPFPLKAYLMVTKPGIIMGNSLTAVGGFALASRGHFDFWLLLSMLEGLSLIIASACVFNNYIDREADKKMKRTQNRPLARGVILPSVALIYATFLLLFGSLILMKLTNLLTLTVALIGFFVYVGFYSFLKYRTVHGTLIGSIAGAVPPVVGYVASTGHIDFAALIIFATIAMWQMPHFFAIAIYRLEDYMTAAIPVLPIKKGIKLAKIQMLFYIVIFTFCSSLLALFSYVNFSYLIVTALLGVFWIFLGAYGFKAKNDQSWARQMFIFSLIAVMTISIAIPCTIF